MKEYLYKWDHKMSRGRVVFDVRNVGVEQHELTLLALPEDFPTIDDQLHSDTRRTVETVASVEVRPGGAGTFAVELAPGRYAMVCFVLAPDGEAHGRKGMNSEFRVV